MGLRENLQSVTNKITQACNKTGRDPKAVKLMAVTKNVDTDTVKELINLGQTLFGENRVQQLRKRMKIFPDVEWHLIGTLQRNKVRYCRDVRLIHSLDRIELAEKLNVKAAKWQQPVNVLIQVNISNEKSKHGVEESEAEDFVQKIVKDYTFVNIQGLMGMAPHIEAEKTRVYFQKLAGLQKKLQKTVRPDLHVLSMGMSNDFEVAVEEGSTLIRVGSALYKGEV